MMTIDNQVLYYQDKTILVRRAVLGDVNFLKDHLRPADQAEIWKSHNHTSHQALLDGYLDSIICLTIVIKDNPVAMMGITAPSLLSDQAVIWFLASDELERIKIWFLRHSYRFVDISLQYYPYLFNYVDKENQKSIDWLNFLGAHIEPASPYGIEQQPFHYFSFQRDFLSKGRDET